MALIRASAAVFVSVMTASTAWGQVIPRPQRSASDASARTQHEVIVQGSAMGGYDDNLAPPGAGDLFALYPGGYVGFGDTSVRYRVGNATRFLEASVGGFMNTYGNVDSGPSYGGEQQLRARTVLGRRNELVVSESVRYAPYFSLGLFGGAQPESGGVNPDNSPTSALDEDASWTQSGSVSFARQLSRNTSADAAYAFNGQAYVGEVTFDSRTHAGTVGITRSLGRWTSLRSTYQHRDGRFEQRDGIVPIVGRTADVGLTYQRRLSQTRQLSLSGAAGASHIETIDLETRSDARFWAPSAVGFLRLDVARTWSVSGGYRRSTSVLQGNTPEAFTSHTAEASVGGDLGRWLEPVVTVGYSSGVSGRRSAERGPGRYEGYTGTVQLRVRIAENVSSVVSVTHFQYHLNEAASQSLDVSREMQRNAVRAGFSWSLPLHGAN
jgi:hypothetical protein